MVNICNCDHITFRTTPVIEELGLAGHGLRYLEVEPAQVNMSWSGGAAWASYHSLEQTLDSIGRNYPSEVDGYRRYVKAAMPAVQLVFDAANDPPSVRGLTRKVLAKRGRGVATMLRWSRRSAADVMREFFTTDALQGPGMLVGPMVWGISPEFKGSGLGALTYALRHVGRVGRPVGGSGEVPRTLRPRSNRRVCGAHQHQAVHHVEGNGVRSVLMTAPRSPRRRSRQPARHVPHLAEEPAVAGVRHGAALAGHPPRRRLRVEARRGDDVGAAPARRRTGRARRRPHGHVRIAPSIADMHRGRADGRGQCSSGRASSQTCRRSATPPSHPTGGTS
jgi:hypothetical protein